MDVLKQCEIWFENGEWETAVLALEDLPMEERTPETDSALAWAYGNWANWTTLNGDGMHRIAIRLLQRHEAYFQGSCEWNYRMAWSHFFLEEHGAALRYCKRALEACPDHEDSQALLDFCQKVLIHPRFNRNFRERTQAAWAAFEKDEAELRRILDEDKAHTRGDELTARCEKLLRLAFAKVAFEIGRGRGGKKYELILTPEGNKAKLFELVYFQQQAPAAVLAHWNILVGRQPKPDIGLRADGWTLDGSDVQAWVEKLPRGYIGLALYSEKLLPLLQQDKNRAWWMLSTLTDQVLGEIPAMRYIDRFDVLDRADAAQGRRAKPAILLEALPQALRDMGLDLSTDPAAYLENSYIGYKMEPSKAPAVDWRMDIIAGSTNCPALVNEYLQNESETVDALYADGAAAGYFYYPLDGFTGEGRGDAIFAFRDKLEAALMENAGAQSLTLTGGATGVYCGYVDFIAWDLEAVLRAAEAFFAGTKLPWARFQTFRQEVNSVELLQPKRRCPRPASGPFGRR